MLTETCPKCDSDLTGGIEGGGLDLSKSSCHNCGHNITVQPAPAVVETVDAPMIEEKPAKAPRAPKPAAPKKPPTAKRASAAKKPALKVTVKEDVKKVEDLPAELIDGAAEPEEKS